MSADWDPDLEPLEDFQARRRVEAVLDLVDGGVL